MTSLAYVLVVLFFAIKTLNAGLDDIIHIDRATQIGVGFVKGLADPAFAVLPVRNEFIEHFRTIMQKYSKNGPDFFCGYAFAHFLIAQMLLAIGNPTRGKCGLMIAYLGTIPAVSSSYWLLQMMLASSASPGPCNFPVRPTWCGPQGHQF